MFMFLHGETRARCGALVQSTSACMVVRLASNLDYDPE